MIASSPQRTPLRRLFFQPRTVFPFLPQSKQLSFSRLVTANCAIKPASTLGVLVLWLMLVIPGVLGQESTRSKPLAAEYVVGIWTPNLTSANDYGRFGGAHEQSPNIAAYSFRVAGPTFEELWNHYAALCGLKQRYAEKKFLNISGTSPKGRFILSERPSGDGQGGRGPSVFFLKTESYAVTVTFAPDPGGKSISGSLTAIVQ